MSYAKKYLVRCIGFTLALGLTPLLTACPSDGGGGGDGGGGNTSDAWSNTAMQSLVAAKCASSGCHNGAQAPNYKGISETAMKADKNALREVSSGSMPPSSSPALTTTEKTTFQNFYK